MNDFIIEYYQEMIGLAKQSYDFSFYSNIPKSGRFVLWRHDCDISLNRARRLAQIENDEDVAATYFINPHCEFYNPLEKSQAKIIHDILGLGHAIGLHFDAEFYGTESEAQLDDQVGYEASVLEHYFGVKLSAFSFHNPNNFLLSCEKKSYGGVINCYSSYFKENIPYCSDSNGYWRYRRLKNVLEVASDPHLQVLTHPGWWQEKPMYPRDRICRAVEGRAQAVIRNYDKALDEHGRMNISSGPEGLSPLSSTVSA